MRRAIVPRALLTIVLPDPAGYGRVVRSGDPVGGTIEGIVEHKDATPAQRRIREVYTGVMAAPTAALKRWLADPVAVALVVVLATTAADFLVHPDHYGNGSLEAILTGVGASGIYLAVTRWLAGGSSVLSAAPGDTGRPSIADKE